MGLGGSAGRSQDAAEDRLQGAHDGGGNARGEADDIEAWLEPAGDHDPEDHGHESAVHLGAAGTAAVSGGGRTPSRILLYGLADCSSLAVPLLQGGGSRFTRRLAERFLSRRQKLPGLCCSARSAGQVCEAP